MLNGHAANSQLGWVLFQAQLNAFQNIFMFPSANTSLLAVGAFVLDDTTSQLLDQQVRMDFPSC